VTADEAEVELDRLLSLGLLGGLCGQPAVIDPRPAVCCAAVRRGIPAALTAADWRCHGSGHVLWCAAHLGEMAKRYSELVEEICHRGFTVRWPEAPAAAAHGLTAPAGSNTMRRNYK
jgi:hypothetical protein